MRLFWKESQRLELHMVNAATGEKIEAILVFPDGITHKEALVAKQAFEEGVKHGKRLGESNQDRSSA